MNVIKILFITKEVQEKTSSKELEAALSPKLGYPCVFHVATDNIVAFELTRLQEFNCIIVAQSSLTLLTECFNIANLETIMKAVDGYVPPFIFLTSDDDKRFIGIQNDHNYYYVRSSDQNEFILDELCYAIHTSVTRTASVQTIPMDFFVRKEGNDQNISTNHSYVDKYKDHIINTHEDYTNVATTAVVPISIQPFDDDSDTLADDIDMFLTDFCSDIDDFNSTSSESYDDSYKITSIGNNKSVRTLSENTLESYSTDSFYCSSDENCQPRKKSNNKRTPTTTIISTRTPSNTVSPLKSKKPKIFMKNYILNNNNHSNEGIYISKTNNNIQIIEDQKFNDLLHLFS